MAMTFERRQDEDEVVLVYRPWAGGEPVELRCERELPERMLAERARKRAMAGERQKRRRKRRIWVGAGLLAALICLGVGIWYAEWSARPGQGGRCRAALELLRLCRGLVSPGPWAEPHRRAGVGRLGTDGGLSGGGEESPGDRPGERLYPGGAEGPFPILRKRGNLRRDLHPHPHSRLGGDGPAPAGGGHPGDG